MVRKQSLWQLWDSYQRCHSVTWLWPWHSGISMMTGYVTISCLMYLEAEGVALKPKVRDCRPGNFEHKFSPGDCCKSEWPLTVRLCCLLTILYFNVCIVGTDMLSVSHCHSITWIRPGMSGDWRICTQSSVPPFQDLGMFEGLWGMSMLFSMVPDLL